MPAKTKKPAIESLSSESRHGEVDAVGRIENRMITAGGLLAGVRKGQLIGLPAKDA